MTEADFQTFATAFGRMCSMFRVRLKANEAIDLTRTYFKLLEPHGLDDVLRTGRTLMETEHKLPLAVDWLDRLNRRSVQVTTTDDDLRQMTVSELEEWWQAEQHGFLGQPCLCPECVRAGVDDRPLRFVPTTFGDGVEDIAYNPRAKRRQLTGHWAHGEELRAWYQACEQFNTAAQRSCLPRVIVYDREPGEEG